MFSLGFALSSLAVILVPGPDLLLVTRLVLEHRRRGPALAAACGMITAGAAQVALGALGLAALLRHHPWLLLCTQWAGALVLAGWGLLSLRRALRGGTGDSPPEPSARRGFAQGFLCTGSNPKVGLFLLAFLPQFVPAGPRPELAIAVLGGSYLAAGLAWLVVWTDLTHRLRRRMSLPPGGLRLAQGLLGCLFLGFAARLALG